MSSVQDTTNCPQCGYHTADIIFDCRVRSSDLTQVDATAINSLEPKWITAAHVSLVANGYPSAWIDITAKEYLFTGFEIPVHSLKVTCAGDDLLVVYRGFDKHEETTCRFHVPDELWTIEVEALDGRYAVWPKLPRLVYPLRSVSETGANQLEG